MLRTIAIAVGAVACGAAHAAPRVELETTIGAAETFCTVPGFPAQCDRPTQVLVGIAPGEDLVVGFQVKNTGTVTFLQHDLADSGLGTILSDFPYTLVPDQVAFITQRFAAPMTIGSVERIARWTASDPSTDIDTDTYGYVVVAPTLQLEVTLAPAADVCANPDDIGTCTLPTTSSIKFVPEQKLAIGFEITSTGIGRFTQHDLADDALGDILVDFPYTLEPGASAFILQFHTPVMPFAGAASWAGTTEPGYVAVATATYAATGFVSFGDGFE